MIEIFFNFFTKQIQTHLFIKLCIIIFCWTGLALALLIDYRSAINAAKKNEIPITSDKMKNSVIKINKYYTVLLFAMIFDSLISLIWLYLNYAALEVPFVTIIASATLIYIEYKSVMENKGGALDKQIRKESKELFDIIKENKELLEEVSKLKREKDDETAQ